MKACLFLIIAQWLFAAQLCSQAPTPKPSADYVVTTGDFAHPGLVAYTAGMTFSQAIDGAGGIITISDVKTIYLIRCGKKEKVDLKLLRRDPSKELILQPWDIVYLPPTIF